MQAGKLLKIKTPTLRRLETTKLLVPSRNEHGQRIYDEQSVAEYVRNKSAHYESGLFLNLSPINLDEIDDNAYEQIEVEPVVIAVDDKHTKWSNHFLKCRTCGRTDIAHYGAGYCIDCYPKTKEAQIMMDYMAGENLAEIGVQMNLSRERVRQLFKKSLIIDLAKLNLGPEDPKAKEIHSQIQTTYKQNRSRREYKSIIEENYENIVEMLTSKTILSESRLIKELKLAPSAKYLIEEDYEEFLEIISHNKNRWSWKHDACKMCGTTEVKHKYWGYCNNCYTKTDEWKKVQYEYRLRHPEEVRARNRKYGAKYHQRPEVKERYRQRTHTRNFDGNRDRAFEVYGDKCFDCGMTRDSHKTRTKKDMPIYHRDGDQSNNDISNLMPLCFGCLSRRRNLLESRRKT